MNENRLSRQEKGALTKQKLFATAVRLIRQKGYANISVNEICREAGVAKGTFYVHYQSKEDIVRESYYCDMGAYVAENFKSYQKDNLNVTLEEKIMAFLLLEFKFAAYIGSELTSLAYIMNLSECVPGPSRHFERRGFTAPLRGMIAKACLEGLFKESLTEKAVFLYLESFVRGLMASWCFSDGEFDIVKVGGEYIKHAIEGVK